VAIKIHIIDIVTVADLAIVLMCNEVQGIEPWFSVEHTFINAGLKWIGIFQESLHIVIFSDDRYEPWKQEDGNYIKSLDIDFEIGNIQVFKNLFLFNTFRSDGSDEYFQLWKSDGTEEGSELIKESLCQGVSIVTNKRSVNTPLLINKGKQ